MVASSGLFVVALCLELNTAAASRKNNKTRRQKLTYSSLMDPLKLLITTPQISNNDEILCIALSRDGEIVASLSKKGIHIWKAPQDGTQGETLESAKALYEANIGSDAVEALDSDEVTKSITVANSGDICAVSFVPHKNPDTDRCNCLGEEIIQGHIGPAFQRAFRRSKIEPDNPRSASYLPIVIQFPNKNTSSGGKGPQGPPDRPENPKTPDSPTYDRAEQGEINPPAESKPKIRNIQHYSSTVFFDVGEPFDSEGIFVCCPPYIYVYCWDNSKDNYRSTRTVYFDIRDIMKCLDYDLNVSDLHSKVSRFALMYQSIPQYNKESSSLRMAMLLNTKAMDVRWKRRFALSSDGSRLAVLCNVGTTGVPSRYTTVHIILMKTGLEVIRWRSEMTPIQVYFHDSDDKLFIVTENQILLYDVNTGKIVKEPMERDGNCMCFHSTRHYYLKSKNQAIEVKTLVPRPKNERMTLELKLVNIIEKEEYFQDNQWALEIMQDISRKQWICCIKKTNSKDSEAKRFSFQPVDEKAVDNEHSPFNKKFRFAVTKAGAVLVITSVTVQLWSPSHEGGNYTLCDFWCISNFGRLPKVHPTVIDLEWDGMRVEVTARNEVGVVLCIKKDKESDSKGYYEFVMKNSNDNIPKVPKVPDSSNASGSNAPNTPKVEKQMAFSCCRYLLLLSRMIEEERCDWTDSPREIENVPELTVEIKKTLQKYIPAYRFPRIHIRLIGSPILYLFNFKDLNAVFTEYRNYRRCIFAWIYESDESTKALFSYVSDNVVKAKIVRWLIRKVQRGETAYGLLLQMQLYTLMDENPELVRAIARGLSYQICVAPIVEKPAFLRQEGWSANPELHNPELHNLDMEILTQSNHLDPIIQFTNHVDFPDGFKFVWLAIASRYRGFLSRWKQDILKFNPNFLSHRRSGSVCVVPLLGLCTYDDTGKSAFTRIAEITLERNFVEIAEPFLEAVVNHKWRAFARQRFYLLFVIYIIYFSLFVILLIKDLPGAKQLSSKDVWIPSLFCAIAGCFIILELLKVWRRPRAYLFVLSNYLELCAFIIPIWYASWVMRSYPVPPGLRSASVLFIWFRLLMQLRIIKYVGIFIAVISEIIKEMIPFLVVLMMAYLGFTQAFYELLRHILPQIAADGVVEGTIDNTVANLSFIPTDSNGQNYSQDFSTVLTNVFFFTTQDYSTMATFEPNVTVLLILFAALIGILLFNVLIALLNNVYTKSLESGQRLWLFLFVQIVADIELLPFIGAYRQRDRTDWFPPYIYYIAYDSKITAYEKAIAQDGDSVRREILEWGPDKQFSDVWENIPDVVEALFDYKPEGKKQHHLPLERGQLVDVIRAFPSGWWYGKYKNKEGLFPCNFVGPYTDDWRPQPTSGRVKRSISNVSLKTLVPPEANTLLLPPEARPVDSEDASNEPPELDVSYEGRLWFPSEGPLPMPSFVM